MWSLVLTILIVASVLVALIFYIDRRDTRGRASRERFSRRLPRSAMQSAQTGNIYDAWKPIYDRRTSPNVRIEDTHVGIAQEHQQISGGKELVVGERVRHPQFGEGIVIGMRSNGRDQEATIHFTGDMTVRRMMVSLSGLERTGTSVVRQSAILGTAQPYANDGDGRNHTVDARVFYYWMGFRFRSKTEIEIAKELDRAGVLFFPNCGARLNGYSLPNDLENVRRTYEPDFLVCAGGRWGILEVDGEPYHPAERAAYDHERDRLFKNHGIRVVERYDASRCWSNPHEVVREFLKLLDTESGWQP